MFKNSYYLLIIHYELLQKSLNKIKFIIFEKTFGIKIFILQEINSSLEFPVKLKISYVILVIIPILSGFKEIVIIHYSVFSFYNTFHSSFFPTIVYAFCIRALKNNVFN